MTHSSNMPASSNEHGSENLQVTMRKAVLLLLVVSASGSASMAQDVPPSGSTITDTGTITQGAADKEIGKYLSGAGQTDMARRRRIAREHRIVGEKAIRSMCVECLGLRYNRPGPKAPLLLPEELSNYQGEPQPELEP